jgi:AraC-like DNA-binding protein
MAYSMSANTLLSICDGLERMQVPAREILRNISVDLSLLSRDPSKRIDFGKEVIFSRTVSRLTKNPQFPLELAKKLEFGSLSAADYLGASSPSIHAVLEVFAAYSPVFYDAWNTRLDEQGDEIILGMSVDGAAEDYRFAVELGFATLWTRLQTYTEKQIPIKGINFRHRHEGDKGKYSDLFGVTPMFGCPRNEMIFESAVKNISCKHSDNYLRATLTKAVAILLDNLRSNVGNHRFADKVKSIARQQILQGVFAADSITRYLSLSPRTLQRKLSESGTSLREILADVRKEIATEMLARPGKSIKEVSYLLGYSDPTSFTRAFHQWFGVSPTEYVDRNYAK